MIKHFSVYADLIKYKLSLAVVLSSLTGYYLYKNTFNLQLILLASGVFLLASGSAALNQYTERVSDSMMERTKNRPVPSKKISEKRSLWISFLLLFSGSIILYFIGKTPFFLGIFNILLYNLLYTHLKKITVLSIIPGALVGAVPPMIGFSSAGGSLLNINIIAFSSFMFLWQLPHFWLIIIKYGKEYNTAGFTTISKYLSEKQIRYLVFFWVLISSGFIFLFSAITNLVNKNILFFLTLLNLTFIYFFYKLLFIRNGTPEIRRAFILINSFSFIIMFFIIVLSIIKGL